MALIDIDNVSIGYGEPARPILNNLTLRIDEGEFVCILGQTGCGKSTLLRLVLGSEQPQDGRILIDGNEHKRPDLSRGYVPQKYSLFPDRTVLDNITFGPEVSEFNVFTRFSPRYWSRRKELRSEAMSWIRHDRPGETDAGKYPDQLSGGMQQRVAIAQALMMRPRILLMDEAFSALDPGTRKDMQRLVRRLWREIGITVLFVTHNMREAVELATRIVVLAKPSPDEAACISRDLYVPQAQSEEETVHTVKVLEHAAGCSREPEYAIEAVSGIS